MKYLHAVEIGFEVLAAIESVIAGGIGSIPFSWQGKKFTITVTTTTP